MRLRVLVVPALVVLAAACGSSGTEGASAKATSTTTMDPNMPGMDHTHASTTPITELNGQKVVGVKADDMKAAMVPDQPLDRPTRAELAQQLVAARAVAMQYPTVAQATAAGYKLAGGFAPGSGAHYIGGSMTSASGSFDPSHPMSLIYDGTNPTSQITGLMYYGISPTAPEGFAGPNDHWHRHSNVCIKPGSSGIDTPFPADADVTEAQCSDAGGSLMKVSGWMVHAWVVPSWESPEGVFSHDNSDVRCADGTYETDKAGFCQGV
jgi:hypothetical protein